MGHPPVVHWVQTSVAFLWRPGWQDAGFLSFRVEASKSRRFRKCSFKLDCSICPLTPTKDTRMFVRENKHTEASLSVCPEEMWRDDSVRRIRYGRARSWNLVENEMGAAVPVEAFCCRKAPIALWPRFGQTSLSVRECWSRREQRPCPHCR